MNDNDMTDYVELAGRTFAASLGHDWDEFNEMTKYMVREQMLPVVAVLLETYQKNHQPHWLEGIG